MSQFSRRARWLNFIFPASVQPQSQDPGSFSDDVSLVQPYDGGGHGFGDINDMCVRSPILDGITGFQVLRAVSDEQVFRLYSVDVALLAGVANTLFRISMIDNNGTGDQCTMANELTANSAGLNPAESEMFDIKTPIIPRGCIMRVEWFFGAVGTTFTIGHVGTLAPLGTVFSV